MADPLTGALARIVESDRDGFNARFAEAWRRLPRLDGTAFAEQLRQVVAPLVEMVDQQFPERTPAVVAALYDLALELCGQELLGAGARHTAITAGWMQVLPAAAHLIAAEPRRVAGAVTNALYTLSAEPTARPQEWIERMRRLAPTCADAGVFLHAGQIAAWCAGLAHFRQGALALCRQLDAALVFACLGIAADAGTPVDALIDKLAANPWLRPERTRMEGSPNLQVVKRAGAFRGLGGLFIAPPTVTAYGADFVVADGEDAWLLTADCFGATFHRVDIAPQPGPPVSTLGYKIVRGAISVGTYRETLPELEVVTSLAANETTLAVTTPLSHAVYLIAVV